MEIQLGLQFLPPEVIGEMASYLTTQDISACSAACSLLRHALNDDLVWKKKCSFKALDYFKWGECEVEPDFQWEKNEPSSLQLPKVCIWRKYFMMQAHLWRNWKFGDYVTVDIDFGLKAKQFDGTHVAFYENDYLFVHSYDISQHKTFNDIWVVQKQPFLHSTLNLHLDQFIDAQYSNRLNNCISDLKINVACNKLVMSLDRLVLIYDLNQISSNFSQIPLSYTFLFDGCTEECSDKTETCTVVSGDYYIGARTRKSLHDPECVQLVLYLWNIQTGEKIKEEIISLNNVSIVNYSLLKSEDNNYLVLKLRVQKDRYMYHYYGYNISKLEFSKFTLKVNCCDFEVLFDDNVIGTGLQKIFVYSYNTSKKIASMSCSHEVLKKTVKVVGGYLLFGTYENIVYVLNPTSLALINKVKLGFTLYSLYPICNKFVVINSTNSEVWKIGKTAKKLFKLPTDSSFVAVNRYGTKLALIKGNKLKILKFW